MPQLLLQGTPRVAQQAELAVYGAEVGVGDPVIRAQTKRALVAIDRRLEFAIRVARGAEIVPRLGESRVEPQRAPVRSDGVVQAAAILQKVAKLVVIRGRFGVASNRLTQRRLGRLELAGAPMHGSNDVPRIGGARRGRGRAARERFGFLEAIERKAMACAQDQFESHGRRF